MRCPKNFFAQGAGVWVPTRLHHRPYSSCKRGPVKPADSWASGGVAGRCTICPAVGMPSWNRGDAEGHGPGKKEAPPGVRSQQARLRRRDYEATAGAAPDVILECLPM